MINDKDLDQFIQSATERVTAQLGDTLARQDTQTSKVRASRTPDATQRAATLDPVRFPYSAAAAAQQASPGPLRSLRWLIERWSTPRPATQALPRCAQCLMPHQTTDRRPHTTYLVNGQCQAGWHR